MTDRASQRVILGKISGLYGVRGWLRVYSHTSPRDAITVYSRWQVKTGGSWQWHVVSDGRAHGKGVVVKLEGCDDRDRASALLGCDIAVDRDELPSLGEGEHYWSDLIGLRVRNRQGVEFGEVDYLFETGANDVLVVKGERERLIPWIREQSIIKVDPEGGEIVVDWDPDF